VAAVELALAELLRVNLELLILVAAEERVGLTPMLLLALAVQV
jgi:hypothetical protein